MGAAALRTGVLFIALAGCAVSPPPQPLQGELAMMVQRGPGVPPGEMVFKPIPGALSGKAEGEPIPWFVANDLALIPVDELVAHLEVHAENVSADPRHPGELVSPRTMRLARLATFYRPDGGDCASYRTGLKVNRPTSGMLVYVDRAGSIRGSRYASPWIMEYALEFPGPGLYLVGIDALGHTISQRMVTNPQPLVVRVRSACS